MLQTSVMRQHLYYHSASLKIDRLARFCPALRKRQRAGAERAAFALARPWLAFRVNAVPRQPAAEGGDQHGAHAVWTPRFGVRLGVDQQRFANAVPGQRDLLVVRRDTFGPEVAR